MRLLRHACLPIPPHPHVMNKSYYIATSVINKGFCYNEIMSTKRSLVLAILFLIIIWFVATVSVSAFLSSDPNWARWHISYLGEGDKLSAHIFNYSMMAGSLLLVALSWCFYKYLLEAKTQNHRYFKFKPEYILIGMLAISLCVYLIGLFPRSFGIMPHDIFGHAIYFIFLILCISSPWILPGLDKKFYLLSYGFHIAMVGLFIAYWTGLSESLYLAEVATAVFFVAWMVFLLKNTEIIKIGR